MTSGILCALIVVRDDGFGAVRRRAGNIYLDIHVLGWFSGVVEE